MDDLLFLALVAAISAISLLFPWKRRNPTLWLAGGMTVLAGGTFCALLLTENMGFSFLRLYSRVLFVFLPAYFFLSALFVEGGLRKFTLGLGLLVSAVGFDAFFIEPRWLAVSYQVIESPLIKRPMRIVSLADIQTDHVGDYERKAVLHARALQADLVVFPGDYIQIGDPQLREAESAHFNQMLKSIGLKPRLGSFAVQGDMENPQWPELFAGSGITAVSSNRVIDLGDVELACLTLHDSRVGASLPPKKKFRIVVGHAPDYAMRPVDADLLLAGHTHGGQVQVPFYGPLITLSQVPRAWAGGGMVTLKNGSHLIVSRGIGHERGPAPRLRFNCRPEVVVVDLVPSPSGVSHGN